MPEPEDIARQLAEQGERLDAVDELAVATIKRLDRHIEGSGAIHRDLRARIAVLEAHIRDLLRR